MQRRGKKLQTLQRRTYLKCKLGDTDTISVYFDAHEPNPAFTNRLSQWALPERQLVKELRALKIEPPNPEKSNNPAPMNTMVHTPLARFHEVQAQLWHMEINPKTKRIL